MPKDTTPGKPTVRCVTHDQHVPQPLVEVDIGEAGSSARREFERRRAGREQHIRDRHPKLGGLIVALSDDPQSTTGWDTGAVGEERLGGRLNSLQSKDLPDPPRPTPPR